MRRLGFALFLSFSLGALGVGGDNKWTSNGPYGGVIGDLYFHPEKNKVAFASGHGLWRSSDTGTTWERLDVEGIVRIHPRNPGTIIAGGSNVYRSTDLGTTWEQLADGPFRGYGGPLYDMEFHPADPQILYGVTGAGSAGGVFKSTDGGRTWQIKNSGINWGSGDPYALVEVDPTHGNIAYVFLPSRKVFKTTDGGESWTTASEGLRIPQGGEVASTLAISPDDPRILYAGGWYATFRTTDAGAHWVKVGPNVSCITVDPNAPQNVYGTAIDLWKSTDYGETWTEYDVPHAKSLYGVAVHPARSNLLLVGAWGEGILRSRNAGTDWELVNNGLDGYKVSSLVSLPGKSNHLFAVGEGRILFESRDGGQVWHPATLSMERYANSRDTKDVQVHSTDPNLILVASYDGRGGLIISTDAGRTWEFRGRQYDGIRHIAVDPRDKNTIFAAPRTEGQPLGLSKTTDMGRTWQNINKGLTDKFVNTIAVDPTNGLTVFVGTERGRIFKSTDGGLEWRVCSLALGGGSVTRIAVHPADSRTVFASTGAGVYKSTDAGTSWTRKENKAQYVFGVADASNPHTVFAGAFGALMLSTDDGETWTPFDATGLRPDGVLDLLIDPSNPNKFHIGTEHGVFSYTRKGAPGGPVIEQLIPSSGKPGDTIAINGTGFGQLQSDSKVLFGALDTGVAQSWSETSIKVTVPTGVQTGPVTVVVLNKKSNPYEFIVLPPSGNVYPTSGPARGGTRVTILAPSGTSGTQFNVLFGSTVAGNVRFTQPNVITCDSPPGAGTVDVKVTSSVTSTTVGTFTYY